MKKGLLIILVVALCSSCERRLEEIKTPDFDVSVPQATYHIGDTVNFNFTGDADIITVYTGEMGNDYDSIKGRTMLSDFQINFETATLDGTQTNQIAILVSKDFDKDYSLDGVARATWADISERFRMATPADNRAWINSGYGDITDLVDPGTTDTLFVAVKHTVRDQNVYGTGNLNRVRNFKLVAANELGESTVFAHSINNWTLFSTPNKMPNRATIEATQMTLRNGYGTAYVSEYTEDWVVSTPIALAPATDMGPDHGVGIKSLADKMLKGFSYVYQKEGTYNVAFLGINQNISGRQEVVKRLVINIIP